MANKKSYRPMMSEKEAKIKRKWHDAAYDEMRKRKTTKITYLGRKFIVPKDVFPPARMSRLLGESVLEEVKTQDRVLDMGTGCGNNAILAASKSSDVVAVDINPSAVKCAKENAKLNNVSLRIRVFKSDLFQNVEGKFDLIIFDPPFRWFSPRTMLERSISDKDYKTLEAFFRNAKNFLNKRGRILIFFGTSADMKYMKHLIKEYGYRRKEVCKEELEKYDNKWVYYVFRLTV